MNEWNDNVYMPPKPQKSPWGGGCRPPAVPTQGCVPPVPPECGCGPKTDPECYPVQPPPGFGCVPPVPSVLEGSSLYEAMNVMAERVNTCIGQWNAISKNCFEALNGVVAAARANDVYYSDEEVHYTEGYDENEGCAYALVEKKVVDKCGNPIFMKLAPAYDNSTNSGVKQSIFDVSFIKSANVIVTAVDPSNTKWYGPAMWKGQAIPGYIPEDAEEEYYQYGFNRQGVLRVFKNGVSQTDLCQNGMIDVIGNCIPILNNGELTTQAENSVKKAAIQAIGYNKGTGSVFIFSCSAQDQPGMTGVSVAKLLQGYGCQTAVITSLVEADNKMVTGGMMYMGQMATVPTAGKEPENLAYWVISKQENFRNCFQKEIADLVQITGQNAWKNYLLGVQIQDFDDRIDQTWEALQEEIARAMQAENWLQENINKEVERAMQAEALLQQNINAEVDRATAEEQRLDQKIDDETARATERENELDQKITDEVNRATQAENAIAADLAAEKLRAMTRENEIQAALDKEIRERIAADNDIINSIEQEVLARRAADTALENKIDAVKKELEGDILNITQIIDGITGGQTNLPYLKLTGGQMSGPITFVAGETVTLGRGPTLDMEAATKKYVDDAVSAGGGSGGGGDVSKDYVDQQITTLQNQLDDKVNKSGDTMTGDLNMDGQQIQNAVLSSNTGTVLDNGAGGPGILTNLATPSGDTDAAPKKYVDDTIKQQIDIAVGDLGDDYLPTAGGQMSGDIDMSGNSVVKFSDPPPTSRYRSVRAAAPSVVKGSVYNDNEDMCVKSENGQVRLMGSEVALSDGAGEKVKITGLAGIDDVVTFASTATDILGPVNITSEAGGATGSINAGAVNVGGTTLEPHVSGGVEHLDIDVPSSTGAVYINRSDNGNPVDGGTGEIHVTKVHAPNELRLNPGTNINVSKKPIKNLDEIRTSTPSADLNIMNSIGAPGNNAGIRVKDISLYSGITRAGYIAGSSLNGINTIELDTRSSNGTIKVNNNGSPARIENVANGVGPNDAVNNSQLETINSRIPSVGNQITYFTMGYSSTTQTSITVPTSDFALLFNAKYLRSGSLSSGGFAFATKGQTNVQFSEGVENGQRQCGTLGLSTSGNTVFIESNQAQYAYFLVCGRNSPPNVQSVPDPTPPSTGGSTDGTTTPPKPTTPTTLTPQEVFGGGTGEFHVLTKYNNPELTVPSGSTLWCAFAVKGRRMVGYLCGKSTSLDTLTLPVYGTPFTDSGGDTYNQIKAYKGLNNPMAKSDSHNYQTSAWKFIDAVWIYFTDNGVICNTYSNIAHGFIEE